jgi:hypothetical protein
LVGVRGGCRASGFASCADGVACDDAARVQLTSSPSAAIALELSITEATRLRNAQYAARGGNGNTLVMSAPSPPPPTEPKQRLITIVLPTTPSDGAGATPRWRCWLEVPNPNLQLGNRLARWVMVLTAVSVVRHTAVACAGSPAASATTTPAYSPAHPASFGRAPGGAYPRPALTVTLPEPSPRGRGRTPVAVSPPACSPAERTAYTPSRLHRDRSPQKRVAFHEPHGAPAYAPRMSSLSPQVSEP